MDIKNLMFIEIISITNFYNIRGFLFKIKFYFSNHVLFYESKDYSYFFVFHIFDILDIALQIRTALVILPMSLIFSIFEKSLKS